LAVNALRRFLLLPREKVALSRRRATVLCEQPVHRLVAALSTFAKPGSEMVAAMLIEATIPLVLAVAIGFAGGRAGGMLTLSAVAVLFTIQLGSLLAMQSMTILEIMAALLAFNLGAGISVVARAPARA
jgi:hypothetical protein